MEPERLTIQCDFDGTITMKDVMVGLNETFSAETWVKFVDQWDKGEISAREALSRMYSMIRASRADVIDYIRANVRIRKGFVDLVDWCADRSIGFKIVSEGLDFVIEQTLEMIGVHVPFITNHALFNDPYMGVEFSSTPPICHHADGDICGTCKVTYVERAQAEGYFVIYIGDGTTDVRPAMRADLVFARRALSKVLGERGVAFVPFEDFDGIRSRLEALIGE